MAYERLDESPLDYNQCRYGQSKLLFRGPRRSLKKDYFAFLGGSETYGKFVAKPFVELVEEATGTPCANFSAINAGVDAFVHDPSLLGLCGRSTATVVQVMGAQNMSNRYYTVHARRNDRFLKASALLKSIYPEVDFTEFSFTRHMLTALKTTSEKRFAAIEMELRAAWVARMKTLLREIDGRRILLWLREGAESKTPRTVLGPEPLFVDRSLVMQLEGDIDELVEVNLVDGRGDLTGMSFGGLEELAAREMLGLAAHQEIADKLVAVL